MNSTVRNSSAGVRLAVVTGVFLAVLAGCATPRDSGEAVYVDGETRAVEGHDTVVYFSLDPEAGAVAGDERFALRWKGATWVFTSDVHRATFETDPDRYAPAFGGYCSMAMAQGKRVAADPDVWTIHDGRLYLFARNAGRRDWREDPQRYIADAEANWDEIRAELLAE
ncbi:MAG: YHS domain-containing (seleno)protein [Spirochaeta sp.]|jgi:YHS domain-containing protein|nr:YHS domain-containing (seleno)protein [Spirochaeta sp.]